MSVRKLHIKKELTVGIVGAGPAGAILAYFLALQGHKVYLFERKATIKRKVCGEYLCPKGVELLEELNLFHQLCAGFNPLIGMELVSPKDEVVTAYFPKPRGLERGLSINRQIFDQRAVDLALERGVIFKNGSVVTHVFQRSNGCWVVDTDKEQFEFDFLVAADGRQSKIGHLLGHVRHNETQRAALHCFLPRKTNRAKRLGEMHIINSSTYCGLNPISDDEVNFSIVFDTIQLHSHKPSEIINQAIRKSRRLSTMFECLPADQSVEIRSVGCLRNDNDFIAGNALAYVGDAAGFLDPLTGEGVYNALWSSHLLAKAIAGQSSLESALVHYKRQKKKLGLQKKWLNLFFQFLIKRPLLIGWVVKYLKKSQERADQFIGIIGNIESPISGLLKMLKAQGN